MKSIARLYKLFLIIICIIITLSCNITSNEFLEQELGIKLSNKITLEVKKGIDFEFSGDFVKLKVYKIKDNFYKEIEQAAIDKAFMCFDENNPLPHGDVIFDKYVENGYGMYKFHNDNFKEYRYIILNKKEKLIIYYFCHT